VNLFTRYAIVAGAVGLVLVISLGVYVLRFSEGRESRWAEPLRWVNTALVIAFLAVPVIAVAHAVFRIMRTRTEQSP
jgi:hypothetical protein